MPNQSFNLFSQLTIAYLFNSLVLHSTNQIVYMIIAWRGKQRRKCHITP